MKTITTVLFINIFFVGGITVIRLSVITAWCEYLLAATETKRCYVTIKHLNLNFPQQCNLKV